MTTDTPRQVLEGCKALVVGIANDSSIAYGCAMAFRELGADLAITYPNDNARRLVEPLAQELGAEIFLPLDVSVPGQLEEGVPGPPALALVLVRVAEPVPLEQLLVEEEHRRALSLIDDPEARVARLNDHLATIAPASGATSRTRTSVARLTDAIQVGSGFDTAVTRRRQTPIAAQRQRRRLGKPPVA